MTTITVVFCLAALSQPNAPDIFIALGNDKQSRQIQLWHEQPFSQSINAKAKDSPDKATLRELELLRSKVIIRTIAPAWDDLEAREQYGIPTVSYPHYKVGKYGSWQRFPSEAFFHPIWSLKYVDYIQEQWFLTQRIEEWEHLHFRAMLVNYTNYIQQVGYSYDEYYDYAYDYQTMTKWFSDRRHIKNPIIPVVAMRPHPTILYRNPLDFDLSVE